MRLIHPLLLALSGLCVPLVLAAAECPVVLNGVFDTGRKQAFALTTDGSDVQVWKRVGESYKGWALVGFDKEAEALTLAKEGVEVVRKLAEASLPPGGEQDMAKALETAAAIMDAMQFEKLMDDTIEAQKKAMIDMQKQMMGGKMSAEDERFQAELMDEVFGAFNWTEVKEGMAKIYAEEMKQSELSGLLNFYNTPTGQAYIDKQGAIQQRTSQLMMPMIMQAMPKIQAKAMAYEREKRTKAQQKSAE